MLDLDDDDDDDDYYDENKNASAPENQVYLTAQGHCERLVLMSVLAPIGHTYSSVAFCLNSLLGTSMVENDFIKLCVIEITSRVNAGSCKFGKLFVFFFYLFFFPPTHEFTLLKLMNLI